MSYAVICAWTPTFGNMPGNYNFILGYSTKNVTNFDVDQEYFLGEIVGGVPVTRKSGNYAFTLTGSQYLWVDEDAKRSDCLPSAPMGRTDVIG